MTAQIKRVKAWKIDGGSKQKRMKDINLTEDAMKKVLSYLSYKEKLPVRLVSHSFNKVISNILNEDFENLADKIDSALNEASKYLKRSYLEQTTIRHFKILYYLHAEYKVIKVTMQKYLENSLLTFTGGSILSYFHKILKTNRKEIVDNIEYMKIFHLVGEYLNNFCMEVDDLVRSKDKIETFNESFGFQIIDILDCGLEFGRNIQFSQGPDCIYLEGEYHANDVNLFEELPDMNKQSMNELEVKSFVRMLRNNVRWSNLLFCIQKDTSELAKDYFTPVEKIPSKTNLTLRKDLFNILRQREKSISYLLTLKCSRNDLPPKVLKLLSNNLCGNANDWSPQKTSISDPPSEFNMLIKMKSKTDEGKVNEKVIKMYHIGDECVSSEFNKIVSMFR